MLPPLYCLSFDSARRARLEERLESVHLRCTFLDNPTEALRLENSTRHDGRTAAVMLDHLRMIRMFHDATDAREGIFCEDDIYLRKTIAKDLPPIISRFEGLDLDVLLLGYLLRRRPPEATCVSPSTVTSPFAFHSFADDLWGSQMYMVSRKHAGRLLGKYTLEYANAHPTEPFSPDWTLTKAGKRCLVYPMLAVEEGLAGSTHPGQREFHRSCFEAQYDEEAFV